MSETYQEAAWKVIREVEKAVVGKEQIIEKIMTAILAGGHILVEDMPGTGKTTMALAFSRAMGLKEKRVQFTPDVLPSDLTGFTIYKKELEKFVYQPGAAMCNFLLADEINRTSPKTQSALLEVMEEGQVTVDGVTRQTGRPFIVMATENPAGSAGTQLLPESQLDRFMICVKMGYPDRAEAVKAVYDFIYDRSLRKGMKEYRPLEEETCRHMAGLWESVREEEMMWLYQLVLESMFFHKRPSREEYSRAMDICRRTEAEMYRELKGWQKWKYKYIWCL